MMIIIILIRPDAEGEVLRAQPRDAGPDVAPEPPEVRGLPRRRLRGRAPQQRAQGRRARVQLPAGGAGPGRARRGGVLLRRAVDGEPGPLGVEVGQVPEDGEWPAEDSLVRDPELGDDLRLPVGLHRHDPAADAVPRHRRLQQGRHRGGGPGGDRLEARA